MWAHPYCAIVCWCICLIFCILGLYIYLPTCLIFPSGFAHSFLNFSCQIMLIYGILFLQNFADDMCSFKVTVCVHNLLLSASRACNVYYFGQDKLFCGVAAFLLVFSLISWVCILCLFLQLVAPQVLACSAFFRHLCLFLCLFVVNLHSLWYTHPFIPLYSIP